MHKKPVTGMKDILPAEMEIRDYLIRVIKETYGKFGFTSIETPCVENIENLSSRQGGENEKLIFKILKRGEKLQLEQASCEADLVDGGLRYDLTVPLARFYANHVGELPAPFKALQIGNVWRADRPQKGRFRQFMQCDIDILGEPSNLAEIELILATTTTLGSIGFQNFKVKLNDRRVLKAMAAYCGFPEGACDEVFIIWDKMDKIGLDGVKAELSAAFEAQSVEKCVQLFRGMQESPDAFSFVTGELGGYLEEEARDSLAEIMESVRATAQTDFAIVFDPTLVRGMSYYTGTIFEIEMAELGSSVAGGGRYDKMIGRFTGSDTPACGFSIGFERIVTILLEKGFQVPDAGERCAYLVEKGVAGEMLCDILAQAQKERAKGRQVLLVRMNKNKKFQKEQLKAQGYGELREFYRESR